MILAQEAAPSPNAFVFMGAAVLVCIFMMFSYTMLVAKNYKRCPSNRVLVIYGRTGENRAARVIHGGASFVVPLLQDYAYLSLDLISVELLTKGVRLSDDFEGDVTTTVTVTIGTEPKVLENAATRMLGLTPAEIQVRAEQMIAGPLRQVLGGLTESQLRSDYDSFQEQLTQAVERQLNEVGLILASANINDITTSS
ncbi:MAG: hypothetical protein CMJ64_14185 [Planctomycetaceae bacterium]|nr:hypothetical protein [Planctomycetaceae bacterium]